MKSVEATLHRLERAVLPKIHGETKLSELVKSTGLKEVEVMRALQWLSNKGLVENSEEKGDYVDLDTNGVLYKKKGLPERRALALLSEHGALSTKELISQGIDKEELNIIIGALKKKAAIEIEKDAKGVVLHITEAGKKALEKESLEEQFLKLAFPRDLSKITPEQKFAMEALKKRKNIIKIETQKTLKTKHTKAGAALVKKGISAESGAEKLTASMLKEGSWKGKRFRPFDVEINVPEKQRGKTHFVNEALSYAKSIWLDMGFEEMTGKHVQTAFWDLDALFVPQDHPAREMQDTYYLRKPKVGRVLNAEVFQKVKAVHENGGDTGSKGWETAYDEDEAKRNLLRTHTTVLSAQMLAKIGKTDLSQLPAKFFTIGKVYRNEALDWKHLFEFHQVDGIVIDRNANLKHLKGYLKTFYQKMGFPDVRMRPGHFPYTEPSIEVEVWHPVKKEWVEMGGAGIFRPEVTKVLLGEEIPVLAWGQGLERIIMPYYKLNDIRELYANDIKLNKEKKKFIKIQKK